MRSRAFGASSAMPIQLTGGMAAMLSLATVSEMPYSADILGKFLLPIEPANRGHALSPSLPVILIHGKWPDVEIGYGARSALADSATRGLPGANSGLAALDVVPTYPAQSYMSGFFDE
jgi:hypothetical protein